MEEVVGVIGLGYVGLPVALAFARHFSRVFGFDINSKKISELKDGLDRTGEISNAELKSTRLSITSDSTDLVGCSFFVVAVPTPVDSSNRPDLTPVINASETVGKVLRPGAVVVFESTVYPGVTEEICGPILERISGLKSGIDFKLGYSPERINPGDKQRTIEKIVKVVSGQDSESLERVANAYLKIIDAGIHKAPSIMVAEAAKVIENTQRDLNIALMNELAIIFDRMNIRTADVLAAAGSKWNFLPFRPGLVGGHCIGVDPFYLTTRAEELGYIPQVILAGRRINDGMGAFIGQKVVKLMLARGFSPQKARVAVFGLTFKEDVTDIRNSKVPDVVKELRDFGVEPLIFDPIANAQEVMEEYGIKLSTKMEVNNIDVAVLAVSHRSFLINNGSDVTSRVKPGGLIADIKSALDPSRLRSDLAYWSL